MLDIRDIADDLLLPNDPSPPTWLWLTSFVVVFLLIALAIFLLLKKNTGPSKRSLLENARSELHSLSEQSDSLPPAELATQASLIIRRYLEAALDDPALFETDEELQLRENALNNINPHAREKIITHLHNLTKAKYAPKTSKQVHDPNHIVQESEQLIATIELNPS